MAAALLCFLLAGPVLLAAGSPVHTSNNGTVPLVLWHGMGEPVHFLFDRMKNMNKPIYEDYEYLFHPFNIV